MKIVNGLVNMFWTILGFLHVVYLWYTQWDVIALVIGLVSSLLMAMLPIRLFKLGVSLRNLENIGVRLVGYMVQNGKLIKRLNPETGKNNELVYASVRERLNRRSMMYERFHLSCCCFFLISMCLALTAHRLMLFTILLISNVLYNVLPIVLQQYYRLRIQEIQKLRLSLGANQSV